MVLSAMGPCRETSTVRERSWRWLGVAGVVEDGDALVACRVSSFPLLWDCVRAALAHGFHVTRRDN